MGREGDSRGTTQIPCLPSHSGRGFAGHFVPTNIGLSYNVEMTVRTTNVTPGTFSHEQLERELRLVSVECGSQQICHISLAASTSLLSSVTAFIGVACYSVLSAKRKRCQGLTPLQTAFNT